MARLTPTRQFVREIAQELLSSGVPPTQSKIRELILQRHGTKASPNVVGDELTAFWKHQKAHSEVSDNAPALAEASESAPPEIPAPLTNPAPNLEDARQHSRESARLHELATRLASKETEISETKLELELSSTALFHSKREISDLTSKNQVLQLQVGEIQSLKDSLERVENLYETRIADLKTGHENEVNRLSSEKTREFEMWDGLRKHLMMETDRMREDFSAKVKNQNEQLERAHLFEQQWRAQAARQSEDIAEANRKLASAEATIAAQAKQISAARK